MKKVRGSSGLGVLPNGPNHHHLVRVNRCASCSRIAPRRTLVLERLERSVTALVRQAVATKT